jgi:hypothetical protein
MCSLVSLVTTSLVSTSSHNVWQVIFMPTFCNMNCHPLENTSLWTWYQMYYSMTRHPPHFSWIIAHYLNQQFPYWWISHGIAQNWPSWSLDMNLLDYCVWGYMKAMVYACKVNMKDELLWWILSDARCINNAAVLHKVVCSLFTQVGKYTKASGSHFEQLALVVTA